MAVNAWGTIQTTARRQQSQFSLPGLVFHVLFNLAPTPLVNLSLRSQAFLASLIACANLCACVSKYWHVIDVASQQPAVAGNVCCCKMSTVAIHEAQNFRCESR
eukprot:3915360-Amphidinium_carterae.1